MCYLLIIFKLDKYKNMKLDEIYKMIFFNYYNENDFKKRFFVKFIRDIVEDLNLI